LSPSQIVTPKIEYDEPLWKHTSVKVGGPARLFTRVRGSEELLNAIRWAIAENVPFMVIGSGSNIVVADAGFNGLVINSISREVRVVREEDDQVIVELDAGTFLPTAAKKLASLGLAGLEWGVGIPGTVGGAVVGNAGAYGGDTAERLVDIDAIDLRGEFITLTNEELAFQYRSSAIKRGEIEIAAVIRARYRVFRSDPNLINIKIRHFLMERKRKEPVEPSIGSTFKNPPGNYAGAIIESAGLKGLRVGGAMVSPKHANYIINTGNATASDIRDLVETIRDLVLERKGIRLETEIEFKGDWQ